MFYGIIDILPVIYIKASRKFLRTLICETYPTLAETMANTICIVLVASLFVLGDAVLLHPGAVKDYIHKKSEETRVTVNKELRLAANEVKSRESNDEQRACVNNQLGKLFNEGNAEVGLISKKLINLADSHSANMPSAPTAVQKVIDSEFAKIVKVWLPEKVEELNKC